MEVVADSSAALRREHVLLSELQETNSEKNRVKGVYLLPPSGRSDVWDGVVFPRSGPLRGGSFLFKIHFSLNYPFDGPPKVLFETKVCSPHISEEGILDLTSQIPNWRPFHHKLIHILKAIQTIFSSPISGQSEEKIRECVRASRESALMHQKSSNFSFSPLNDSEIDSLIGHIDHLRTSSNKQNQKTNKLL